MGTAGLAKGAGLVYHSQPMARLRSLRLGPLLCTALDIEIRVAPDQFDDAGFRRAIADAGNGEPDQARVAFLVLNTKHAKRSDFHAHVIVSYRERHLDLRVEYHQGSIPSRPKESPPFAENALAWTCSFVRAPTVRFRAHATFRFPAKQWVSALRLPSPVSPLLDPTPDGQLSGSSIVGMRIQYAANPLGLVDTIQDAYDDAVYSRVALSRASAPKQIDPADIAVVLHQAAVKLTRRSDENDASV